MVCELEGPTPILYRSKRLAVTHQIVVGKESTGASALESPARISLFEKLVDFLVRAVKKFMQGTIQDEAAFFQHQKSGA